jgi:hypothetical protein
LLQQLTSTSSLWQARAGLGEIEQAEIGARLEMAAAARSFVQALRFRPIAAETDGAVLIDRPEIVAPREIAAGTPTVVVQRRGGEIALDTATAVVEHAELRAGG